MMYGRGFPVHLTPVLILVVSLGITFWVWDGAQFSHATRVICSVLTSIIAIILAAFVLSGFSNEYSAGVILFEAFFLGIQFVISQVAHTVKTPS